MAKRDAAGTISDSREKVRVIPEGAAAEWVPLSALKPWGKNPRKNDGKPVDKVAESIEHFGFGTPILARKADGEVIAGHTRLKAAKKLGLSHVPVRWMDLDEVKAHALAIADNRTSAESTWDDAQLNELMLQMSKDGVDLALTAFDDAEIKKRLAMAQNMALAGVEESDEPLEVPAEPISKPGEVYELGPHRLMCGDATVQTDMDRLMDGAQVDLLWTDPPYNVAYVGGTKDSLTIKNDKMGDGAFRDFLRDAFATATTGMRPGAAFYIAMADIELYNTLGAIRDAGWKFSQMVIWEKDQLVLGRKDYHFRHEPILYGWKDDAAHHQVTDRKQDTVWECPRPKRSTEHPTMKPVELIERAIKNSTDPGERVLDPFGGSGSTLIAAAKTGRVAYLMELDPRYCDVIRYRWQKFLNVAQNVANP